MSKQTRRGYQPKDEKQFGEEELTRLRKAGEEVQYLLDRGYQVKQVTTFVGNHYMFSERQRLALARGICSSEELRLREQKRLEASCLQGSKVYIDGFNTLITLEVALSGSLVLGCRDGCIRDLAGLRGTYHIINDTSKAITLVYEALQTTGVGSVTWYLDSPVSNSGRLKQLIESMAESYRIETKVEVIHDVDRTLEAMDHVVTSDAIILSKCKSWWNLNKEILNLLSDSVWIARL